MTALRLFWKAFLEPLAIAAAAGAGAWFLGGKAAFGLVLVAAWHVLAFVLRVVIHRQASAAILANHPDPLKTQPATKPPPEEFVELELKILSLGFQNATPLLDAEMSPPSLLRGFFLPGQPVYASAFCADGTEPGFDFVSVIDGGRGLTTSANPKAAVLPRPDGALRQVFPGLEPDALLEKHLSAVAALEAKGVRFEPARAEAFLPALRSHLSRMRAEYLKNRFTWTRIAIDRLTTKKFPDHGPVVENAEAVHEVVRLSKAA